MSFEKLGSVVTKDNYKDLMLCLLGCVTVHLMAKEKSATTKLTGFTWIDDGKNEITGVTVTNPNTKKEKTIKFKNPIK